MTILEKWSNLMHFDLGIAVPYFSKNDNPDYPAYIIEDQVSQEDFMIVFSQFMKQHQWDVPENLTVLEGTLEDFYGEWKDTIKEINESDEDEDSEDQDEDEDD